MHVYELHYIFCFLFLLFPFLLVLRLTYSMYDNNRPVPFDDF